MQAKIKKVLSVFVLFGLLCNPINIQAFNDDKDIQTIIHLLDYIAKDYPMAVQDSEIINEMEYQEMLNFANLVITLSKDDEILKDANILPDMEELLRKIKNKKTITDVAEFSRKIKLQVVEITDYVTYPQHWPDISNGAMLYNQSCVACHGAAGAGDGTLAAELDPVPTNFLDDSLMKNLSPFQAYNSIRLGISGTAMRAFPELTDEQVWDLAFYIKSLRFSNAGNSEEDLAQVFNTVSEKIPLEQVASLDDHQIGAKLNSGKALAALRLHSGSKRVDDRFLGIARENVHSAIVAYKEADYKRARQLALSAYLDGIEPIEARLSANDPEFTASIEKQMLALRMGIEKRIPVQRLEEVANSNLELFNRADALLGGNGLNFWLSFLLAASIILREGLEAFLIIAVILAIIKRSGNTKALPWLHGGWIFALALGYLGWHFSGWVLDISGKNRELLEGGVALFAVVILTVVGFWLHNNSHARQWKIFIEDKIHKLLQKENMWGLAFFSFIVVFREAFESVLFLQAINLETSAENKSAIGLGVLVAFAVIAVLMLLFVKFSKKIPVRQMFRYSAWMITLLAVILIGKGIHSIQESGVFSVTQFPFDLRLEWAGIYPTFETMTGQMALLVFILLLWFFQNRRMKLQS